MIKVIKMGWNEDKTIFTISFNDGSCIQDLLSYGCRKRVKYMINKGFVEEDSYKKIESQYYSKPLMERDLNE
jgi:hypothetical protein